MCIRDRCTTAHASVHWARERTQAHASARGRAQARASTSASTQAHVDAGERPRAHARAISPRRLRVH
eukprot:3517656-Alexandrium_andersonii.AAC.1